jgi:hypothetical protein
MDLDQVTGSSLWRFREDTLFWEERWIRLFSEESRSTYFGTKMAPCGGGRIWFLRTQLLDPVVYQSAQISYRDIQQTGQPLWVQISNSLLCVLLKSDLYVSQTIVTLKMIAGVEIAEKQVLWNWDHGDKGSSCDEHWYPVFKCCRHPVCRCYKTFYNCNLWVGLIS